MIGGNGRRFCPCFHKSSSVLCQLMTEMRRVFGESSVDIRTALHLPCDNKESSCPFLASTEGKDLFMEGGGIGLILIKISLNDNVF